MVSLRAENLSQQILIRLTDKKPHGHLTHVTRQAIFVSREAAKNAKKKYYIDRQDKQDFKAIFYPVYPVYRCKNKSSFAP
jgi:hypothetical protein